ncbi:MAG: hypothetical protein HRF40_10610 [Nitrososphaera sp.]|jgi:hypothetical protein
MTQRADTKPGDLRVAIVLQFIVGLILIGLWISSIVSGVRLLSTGDNVTSFFYGALIASALSFVFAFGFDTGRRVVKTAAIAIATLESLSLPFFMLFTAGTSLGGAWVALEGLIMILNVVTIVFLRTLNVKRYFYPDRYVGNEKIVIKNGVQHSKRVSTKRVGVGGALFLGLFGIFVIVLTGFTTFVAANNERLDRDLTEIKTGSTSARSVPYSPPQSEAPPREPSPLVQEQIRRVEEACAQGHDALSSEVNSDIGTWALDQFLGGKLLSPYDQQCQNIVNKLKEDSIR